MPFSFPSEINIGNRTVGITLQPNLIFEETGDTVMGLYDDREFRIIVNADLSLVQQVETFWHELMHAIFAYNRFTAEMVRETEDGDSPEFDAFKFEEMMAERFAKTLLQVMQDNPMLQNIKS